MPAAVVLVHGLRGSRQEWDAVGALLARAGHDVIAPDLPGHGSRQNEQFTITESIETIAAAALSAARVPVIVGHALGGHLAIRAAVTADVAGVVAVGCGTEALGWLMDSYRIASAAY